MLSTIVYEDAAGIIRCRACSEPIWREDVFVEDDFFAAVSRLFVRCVFCGTTKVEEQPLPCVGCAKCEAGANA